MSRSIQAAISGLLLASLALTAHAEADWSLSSGLIRTDNAARSATGEVEDTLASVGGGAGVSYESGRVNAELSAAGNFLTYLDNTFDDDFVGSASGHLNYQISPQRFEWMIEDTFGQVATNAFAPTTPDNREDINVFSTGPQLTFRLGGPTELGIGANYRRSDYSNSGRISDTKLSGSLALTRRTSAKASWAIVGQASRTEFDAPGNPGFDTSSVFARLQAEGARQTIALDLGATRFSDFGDSQTSPLLRLQWNRQLTPSWSLAVTAGTEFRNATDRFVADFGQPDSGAENVFIPGASSRSDFLSGGLAFARGRTTFGLGGNYGRDEFVTGVNVPDLKYSGYYASVTRRMTERLTGRVRASFDNRELDGTTANDDTTQFGASLDWRLGRTVYLSGGYRHEARTGGFASFEYDENIFYLMISYRSGENAAAPEPIF